MIREMESAGDLQRGASPILEKAGMEGTCVVANSKNSEKTKHEHPRSVLLDAAVIQGQARLSGPYGPAGRGLHWAQTHQGWKPRPLLARGH